MLYKCTKNCLRERKKTTKSLFTKQLLSLFILFTAHKIGGFVVVCQTKQFVTVRRYCKGRSDSSHRFHWIVSKTRFENVIWFDEKCIFFFVQWLWTQLLSHFCSWNNERFANYTQLPARVYDEEKSSWGEELKKRVIETLSKYNIRFKVQKSGDSTLLSRNTNIWLFVINRSWFSGILLSLFFYSFKNFPFNTFPCLANGEARRRHRRRMMMMPLMVFGMAVLGVIIIPLSFHVMGSLAGLAVFLGKLALLIASITSLKRVNWIENHGSGISKSIV